MKRREITKGIGVLVGGLLLTDRQPSRFAPGQLLHSEELFSVCSTTIPILWRLYFEGHLSEVQALLPECLSQLSLLVQNPGYQKAAARLASQACQLAALIEKHLYNSGNALLYAKQGEEYGQVAEDLNLQIAALIQQGNIYWDLGQAWRELEAYQKAYQLTQEFKQKREISPLLLGRVSVGLAKSYGKFADQKQQALRFLGEAYERYPERPEADLAFSYTYHTRFTLFNHAGLTYLHIGQPEEALRTFESLSVPAELVPRRLEFLIRLSMTSLALGNLEQAVEQTALAATSARMLGSDLRYHEAYKLYEQMLEQWPQEAQVKALAEHFR